MARRKSQPLCTMSRTRPGWLATWWPASSGNPKRAWIQICATLRISPRVVLTVLAGSNLNQHGPVNEGGAQMAVVKVIELLAQSPDGWEAATQEALREASKTIRDIQSVYIKEFQAIVENDQIRSEERRG